MHRGFTLVEILVASTLMAISILLLVSVVTNVQYVQRTSLYVDEANRVARSKIENLKSESYDSLIPGSATEFDVPSSVRLPDNTVGTVTISTPTLPHGTKRVEVTVAYYVGPLQKSVTLMAYIAAPGSP